MKTGHRAKIKLPERTAALLTLTAILICAAVTPALAVSGTDDAQSEDAGDTEYEDLILTQEEYDSCDWNTLATTDVSGYLNIRDDADADAQIIGRLYAGALVTVENQTGDESADTGGTCEWTKISSGNVEGYAATQYLLFGSEAEEYIAGCMESTAVVTGDLVRIRTQASIEASIAAVANADDVLTWDSDAQTPEGWTAVIYNGETCYISSEFVQTGIRIGTAMTNEEAAGSSTVSYSDSDLTLLASLIYCEAGGESYAGKLAVGAVVMNRVESSSYPDTISGVIYQSGQFSPVSSGWLSQVLSNGTATESCYEAALEALSGVSNVGSCLHFHAGSGSGTQIGSQVFY